MKSKKSKHDRSRKCLKYIEKGDLPRLKSYLKKHKLDVNGPRLEGDNTLLHAACRLGHDHMVSYFLKKGADCLMLNAHGDLPIHLAVRYALSGHTYAYTDLVLPLIKKAPKSLDRPNAAGHTCRELLQQYKATLSSDVEDSDTESSESDGDVKETKWSEKLYEEMAHEYADELGGECDQAYYTSHEDTESWDQWAERIHHEHRTKTNYTFHPTTNRSRTRKRHTNGTDEPPKRPRISEEKRKAFEENMKLEHQQQRDELARVRNIIHQKSLEVYETMCTCLFGGVLKREIRDQIISDASKERSKILREKFAVLENKSMFLGFNDVPWPVKADAKFKYRWDICEDLIVEFLFRDMKTGSKLYVQRLKTEQRRWHPDRFLQKCSARLKELDKDTIIETVTKISQIFNKLSQNGK